MPTIGRVEPFQIGVDDWDQYTETRAVLHSKLHHGRGQETSGFLTMVGKKTYSLLSNLLAPVKPAAKSFEELVAVVKDHVAPKPLIITEKFRFHQRNQG